MAATSEIAEVTTAVQYPTIRRDDSAPHWAESISLWNASSSMASSSTRATRPKYRSVATRCTLGSRIPVAAAEADFPAEASTARTATTTREGSAERSRSTVLPWARSSTRIAFTAISDTAWVTPRPNSAATTVYRARRSASRASRTAMPTCRGSESAMARRLSFSQTPWCRGPSRSRTRAPRRTAAVRRRRGRRRWCPDRVGWVSSAGWGRDAWCPPSLSRPGVARMSCGSTKRRQCRTRVFRTCHDPHGRARTRACRVHRPLPEEGRAPRRAWPKRRGRARLWAPTHPYR